VQEGAAGVEDKTSANMHMDVEGGKTAGVNLTGSCRVQRVTQTDWRGGEGDERTGGVESVRMRHLENISVLGSRELLGRDEIFFLWSGVFGQNNTFADEFHDSR
jgi:hypothetical protein